MNEMEQMIADAPVNEPERQYYFMEKGKALVASLSEQAGHPLTFCVTTFGCQVNTEHEISKAA